MTSAVLGEPGIAEPGILPAKLLQHFGGLVRGMIVDQDDLSKERSQLIRERTQPLPQGWKHGLLVVNGDNDAKFWAHTKFVLVYRSYEVNRSAFRSKLSPHFRTHCGSTVWSTHR